MSLSGSFYSPLLLPSPPAQPKDNYQHGLGFGDIDLVLPETEITRISFLSFISKTMIVILSI